MGWRDMGKAAVTGCNGQTIKHKCHSRRHNRLRHNRNAADAFQGDSQNGCKARLVGFAHDPWLLIRKITIGIGDNTPNFTEHQMQAKILHGSPRFFR